MSNMLAIIGGSGLENPDILKNIETVNLATPYGNHSDLIIGEIHGKQVAILSRHGKKHNIPPTQINNRANIFALKEIGCDKIIATTAVGSLREEIKPGDIVFPDQFIDFTRHRAITFFEDFPAGEMKHCPMADPFHDSTRQTLIQLAAKMKLPKHDKATILTIEGPRFSTRAESHMFRAWGADLINMSTAPEVILANEAGIFYAAIAMSTDYDSWRKNTEPVTWEAVLSVFQKNVHNVLNLLIAYIKQYE
jgi:5'-methylthioadenosine phosphorylase